MIELDDDVLAVGPNRRLELDPNMNGSAILDGSTVIGKLEIDSGEMRFKWASSTAAWPASFTVDVSGGHSFPSLAVQDDYEHQTFPGSSAGHDIGGCEYEIRDGSTTVGWLKVNTTETVWFGLPAYISGGYLQRSGSTLSFVANPSSGTKTTHKVTDAKA